MKDTPLIIEPKTGPARSSFILLHGLGASADDLLPIGQALQSLTAAMAATRFIFPPAPIRAVTINGGMPMPAWYDVYDSDFIINEDRVGLDEAAAIVARLIAGEQDNGIAPDRIIVGGFSQGGAVALHAGLRYPHTLAGLLVMSGYLPVSDTLDEEAAPVSRQTPVLMLHGSLDPIVPVSLARQSRDRMNAAGYHVQWHHYPMEHAICPEEIETIRLWLEQLPVAALPALPRGRP